ITRPTLRPLGPSPTVVVSPGYQGSIGTHGRTLWWLRTSSPRSLMSSRLLKGLPFGLCSPVSEKMPQTLLSTHARLKTSTSGPSAVVVRSIHLVGWNPWVLYSGKMIRSSPGYSTQGFHPTKWMDLTTTADGPEVEVFKRACVENKVWGIFSLTGEHNPKGNPFNSLLLINDRGELVLNHHKVLPWVPMEPWYPGDTTTVGEGPKGLKVGLVICYEGNHPEIFRDTVMKGAELVVRCQGYMYPSKDQQRIVAQCRA